MTEAERSTDKNLLPERKSATGTLDTKRGQRTKKERTHTKRIHIEDNLTNDQVTLTSRSPLNDGLTMWGTGLLLHVIPWPVEWLLWLYTLQLSFLSGEQALSLMSAVKGACTLDPKQLERVEFIWGLTAVQEGKRKKESQVYVKSKKWCSRRRRRVRERERKKGRG